jgi:hypothetical protein
MTKIRDFEPVKNLRTLISKETEKESEINENSNGDNNEAFPKLQFLGKQP